MAACLDVCTVAASATSGLREGGPARGAPSGAGPHLRHLPLRHEGGELDRLWAYLLQIVHLRGRERAKEVPHVPQETGHVSDTQDLPCQLSRVTAMWSLMRDDTGVALLKRVPAIGAKTAA